MRLASIRARSLHLDKGHSSAFPTTYRAAYKGKQQMKYPLENLGPLRFQQLCQALLARSFPDLQCLPISQPDGGRDAIWVSDTNPDKQTVLFQVKYTEHALRNRRPHMRIVSELRKELPRLAPHFGPSTKYILMTNVPGTGARASGSIDVVQALSMSS